MFTSIDFYVNNRLRPKLKKKVPAYLVTVYSYPFPTKALKTIIPLDPNKPYDIKDVIRLIADHQYFFEIHKDYAPNIVVGFARMKGYPVGIIANQPNCHAGCLDIRSSKKGARFVRFCDAFNIPLLILLD